MREQIECLSGGQKSRVAFAILCGHAPNFLILDEPTNHLDVQTIEALGNAILKYKASITRWWHTGNCVLRQEEGSIFATNS